MSIHEKLWKKLPEVLCYIVYDERGFSGFCYRPSFDCNQQKWVSDNDESFDFLDVNDLALPRPFQRLCRVSPSAAIFQRPSSWDGEVRIGDSARLSCSAKTFTVSGFFNHEKIWLEDAETRDIKMVALSKVVLVNGMTVKGQRLKTQESLKMPDLPPEVHNQSTVDVDRAMAVLRSMCRGG